MPTLYQRGGVLGVILQPQRFNNRQLDRRVAASKLSGAAGV